MKRKSLILLLPLFILANYAYSQPEGVVQNYIDTYKELAVEEMQRTGVPAAIKLAQGIHETMAGTSNLVVRSNNHFGIKCKSNWTGPSVSHDDDARGECFRKYPSADQSYRDHSDFLKGSSRYASLFVLDPTDYTGWAYGLKKAGYATNPKYPAIIIRLIEQYQLQDYTLIAMGKLPAGDIRIAKNEIAAKTGEPVSALSTFETEKVEIVHPAYPAGEFRIKRGRRRIRLFLFM